MIIDIHTHYHGEMQRLVGSARKNGIDRICVSSLGLPYIANPTPEQIRACNDQTLGSMKRFPDAVIGFCYLNPLHEPAGSLDELRRCVRAGMRGVKLWIATQASDPCVDPIAEEAASRELPLLQHAAAKATGNRPGETTPDDVAVMARRHPRLTIIMAHLTLVGVRGINAVRDCPNVFVDTSGGDPAAGITDFTVRTLGAARLLYGSDAPGRNYAVQLARVRGALAGSADRNAVLGGNARKILGID